jgi:hypothetical protein
MNYAFIRIENKNMCPVAQHRFTKAFEDYVPFIPGRGKR